MVCIIVSLYCQNVISLFFQKKIFTFQQKIFIISKLLCILFTKTPHERPAPRGKIFHEDLRRKYLEDTQQIFHFAWSNVAGAPSNVMCI